jgi:ankyrin repeat protein
LKILRTDEPITLAVVAAIHSGDIDTLRQLLDENPGLAAAHIGDDVVGVTDRGMSRSLLHVVTDWPGHFPNSPLTVALLVEAGADVNARFAGPHTETPLHWAASSDDVAVLDALLDAGADIEARGGVIGGGTPMADATAFKQWKAAHRLVERGARMTLFDAAALGLMSRISPYFRGDAPPTNDEINGAFWAACHGGRSEAAAYLLDRGAELNWIPTWEEMTPLDAARRERADQLVEWLRARGGKSASELD